MEANGGMMVPDGSRKRTVGGIFFYLVQGGVTPKERWPIWSQRTSPQPSTGGSSPSTEPALPTFRWEDARSIIDISMEHSEEARTVKITIIGRPGQVTERQGVMILGLRHAAAPSLPKGLPDFPAQPTRYMVFIATKQWRRVADLIKNPEDLLIIEGYPTQHPQYADITVYATSVTTTLQQQAKRQQQAAARAPSA